MGLFSFFRRKPQSHKSRAQRRRDADNRSLFEKHASQLPSTTAAAKPQPKVFITDINPKAHDILGTNYSHPTKPPPKSSNLSRKKQQPKPQPPQAPRKSQISAPQQTPFAHPSLPQRDSITAVDAHHVYHSAIQHGYPISYTHFQPAHPPPFPPRFSPYASHGTHYAHKSLPAIPGGGPVPSPPKAALLPAGKVVQNRHRHGAVAAVVHPDHQQQHPSMRAEVSSGGWKSKAQEASFRPLSEIGLVGREARGWAEREMGGYFDEEVRRGSRKEFLDG